MLDFLDGSIYNKSQHEIFHFVLALAKSKSTLIGNLCPFLRAYLLTMIENADSRIWFFSNHGYFDDKLQLY